jgi:Fe-S cluster assembly protein SufD
MRSVGAAHCVQEAERLRSTLPGAGVSWIEQVRDAALARFADAGFPTLRDEDWKHTNVAPIEASRFAFAPSRASEPSRAQIDALLLPGAHALVFVDGHLAPALSRPGELPAGVTLGSVADALRRDPESVRALWHDEAGSAFAALNQACAADGARVRVSTGIQLDAPIQLLFITTQAGLATQCRSLISAEEGARASIIEQHVSWADQPSLGNHVTRIDIGPGAEIEHHKLQNESAAAFHVATIDARLGERGGFNSSSFALGAALSRADIRVALAAERTSCTLDGLYVADGQRHVDHHTRIDHLKPRGTSRELYKGVLADAARAVFNGRLVVHRDAQRSDASQSNRNLLLSDESEVDTQPQLEIYADDVQCGHGATVGQLDADQIFYLRSRGVSDASARAWLTYAFAAEMIERVRLAPLRAYLDTLLRARLPAMPEAL